MYVCLLVYIVHIWNDPMSLKKKETDCLNAKKYWLLSVPLHYKPISLDKGHFKTLGFEKTYVIWGWCVFEVNIFRISDTNNNQNESSTKL